MEEILRSIKYIKENDFYPKVHTVDSAHDPIVKIGGRDILLMSSNSYLGLNKHPNIIRAAIDAAEKYGVGAGSARLLSGTLKPHVEAEAALAELKNEEAAILFTAGFLVNMGVIPALMNVFSLEKDRKIDKGIIFSDEYNHNCIIIGSKLSGAEREVYKHLDLNDLEERLRKYPKNRRKLIVTDGIFSLDGDIAPLDKLSILAEEYNAMLMVDDAHATGVLGEHGGGTVDYYNLPQGKVDVVMGTASKGLGISGGFVSGNKELMDYLRITARSYIFATAPSPIIASSIVAAVKVVQDDQLLRKTLWDNRNYLTENINKLGFSTMQSKTQIIPILLGDEIRAAKFADELFKLGVFVPAVRWPAVPIGQARIRVTVTALHKKEHLDNFLNILESLKKKNI